MIERAVILSPGEEVSVHNLSIAQDAQPQVGSVRVGANVSLEELERAHIVAVMASTPTLDMAATTLGIDASTLYRKRKQYGL